MSDPASQKNSSYILLVLLSILVVATLVVASLYFVGPNIKTTAETAVTEGVEEKHAKADNIEKSGTLLSEASDTLVEKKAVANEVVVKKDNLEPAKKEKIVEVKAEQTPEPKPAVKPKDDCDVRFTGNQLLVKNTKQ